MLLNGYLSYRLNGPSRPDLERIAPWQYALIQRLDLCLKQARVERDGLGRKLRHWEPALRHSGVYVAPRYYGLREAFRPTIVIPAHNFGLVVPLGDNVHKLTDGDKVILPQEYRGFDSSERAWMRIKSNFTARAMVARTLTHLTLRMSRTDWWTWSDDPDTTDDDKQLALDPACGWSARPLVAEMLDLAASRRKGQHPAYRRTWGATIGTLQDLKSIELILETFSIKKHQLETVVECAQTWKFPLEDTQYELAYDGKMESMRWAQAADEKSSSVADSKLGGMNVDLNEGDSSCDERREAHGSCCEDPASNQESLHIDEEAQGRDQEVEDVFDEDELPHPVYEPEDWPVEHHEHYDSAAGTSPMSSVYKPEDCPVEQSEYSISSPISPRWDPVSDSDDLESLPDEPWMHTATEFEVRIVRFTRRRVN